MKVEIRYQNQGYNTEYKTFDKVLDLYMFLEIYKYHGKIYPENNTLIIEIDNME